MAGQAFSAFAALAALTFLAMAMTSCASSGHMSGEAAAPAYKGNGVAEFHDAHIGGDALRQRLPGE